MKQPKLKCAIYTRKSSEEGLDQEFNSLHAQREACEAYITSQKAEGWSIVPCAYDDGGISGGTLERPDLQKLLDDIRAGKVNIVVVYKIDRLTRSLMDFSKLVEIFDEYGVTFVSITQSFNTTTSMGRLTLNVLLSFAQFEREVTGERIRDKIAASKAKGMWMGGRPPFGYDIEDRQLVVNKDDAKTTRIIFELYLDIGCVRKLHGELTRLGIKSRERISEKGTPYGGQYFSRGALYGLLSNPVYIGKISHKGKIHEGLHPAIIELNLWDQVQEKLQEQAPHPRGQAKTRHNNLLTGKIFDEDGNPYTPVFTKKQNKRYRYYCNDYLAQQKNHPNKLRSRLPAHEIESFVKGAIKQELKNNLPLILGLDVIEDRHAIVHITNNLEQLNMDLLINAVNITTLDSQSLTIKLSSQKLGKVIFENLKLFLNTDNIMHEIRVPYQTRKAKDGAVIIEGKRNLNDTFDLPAKELKHFVQGIIWRDEHFGGLTIDAIARRDGVDRSKVGKIIRASFDTLQTSL